MTIDYKPQTTSMLIRKGYTHMIRRRWAGGHWNPSLLLSQSQS